MNFRNLITSEPYRFFFPLGTLFLLCGVLLWVPQLWNNDDYPVALHRFLVINSFVGCYIGGFLMTAVPRFSETHKAKILEVSLFFFTTIIGVVLAHFEKEKETFLISALQALLILTFLFGRIFKRKANPPYSFVFIFVGLILWCVSAMGSFFIDMESFKVIHYEGAIAAIILGVGSRLIPGILGHVDVIPPKGKIVSIISTVPKHFFLLIFIFVGSYFQDNLVAHWARAFVVMFIGLKYWKLYQLPKDKTALTYSIWSSGVLIVLSFILRAAWDDGGIHASHGFFINGLVLLSFLIATRVIQSHGPQDKKLEDWKGLYVVTGLIVAASLTRVSAYLMPDSYLSHLAYSSILLTCGIILWSLKYIRFVLTKKGP